MEIPYVVHQKAKMLHFFSKDMQDQKEDLTSFSNVEIDQKLKESGFIRLRIDPDGNSMYR